MLRFHFKRPIKSYTAQGAGDHVGKIVLPKWFSYVELGAHSFVNDECEVHSFRSPRTVRIGRYSSVGRCEFIVDGDHNTRFASTYPLN